MAAKDISRVKLDDFVAAARKGSEDGEPLLFTSGYVGRSATEGNLRIYSDPSLSRWIEAAEEDVVHSMPIADSPLGGSHLWLKGSAKVSPGVAGGPTGEPGGGLEGPLTILPETSGPCLDTRHPICIQQHAPVTRLIHCPTQPPMCIREQAPWQPFTMLGCTGFACVAAPGPAARAEPVFTDPVVCPGETGHIPCENFPPRAARAWFTVHFCAAPRAAFAGPIGQTGWQTCACPPGQTGWRTCACPVGPPAAAIQMGATASTLCIWCGPVIPTQQCTWMPGCPNTPTGPICSP